MNLSLDYAVKKIRGFFKVIIFTRNPPKLLEEKLTPFMQTNYLMKNNIKTPLKFTGEVKLLENKYVSDYAVKNNKKK